MTNPDSILLPESITRYLNIIQGAHSTVSHGKEANRVCIADDILEEMADYNITTWASYEQKIGLIVLCKT